MSVRPVDRFLERIADNGIRASDVFANGATGLKHRIGREGLRRSLLAIGAVCVIAIIGDACAAFAHHRATAFTLSNFYAAVISLILIAANVAVYDVARPSSVSPAEVATLARRASVPWICASGVASIAAAIAQSIVRADSWEVLAPLSVVVGLSLFGIAARFARQRDDRNGNRSGLRECGPRPRR